MYTTESLFINGHGYECGNTNDFGTQNNSNDSNNSNNTTTTNNSKKIISIDIKAADEIMTLSDPNTTTYDFLQYRKLIDTPRDIIFSYKNLQKAQIYHHRQQTIAFHKFKPLGNSIQMITIGFKIRPSF